MNRRLIKEIKNVRDSVLDTLNKVDELADLIIGEEEPTEEEWVEADLDSLSDMTNWSAADEPAKDTVYMKDLKELTELKGLTIVGQIKSVFDLKSYVKGEGGAGLIYRFVLSDKTGDMTVISFDDMATELKQYMIGQILKITNAWKMQENKHGKIELHVGNFAKVEVIE